MYKHILVATDGSELSGKAINTAAKLAKLCGARLTGVYVIEPYVPPPVYGEGSATLTLPLERYKEIAEKEAKEALAAVQVEAENEGVPFSTEMVTDTDPWQGIVNAAGSKKCDLIVMASHGRRGLAGLLLGSETTKVLTHSKTPVLVCR
jgi:nucleotide-binding universal stress UspA family protein